MSRLKSYKEDLILNSTGDIPLKVNGLEVAKMHNDGVVSSQASVTNQNGTGDNAIITKGYVAQTEHTHTNTTTLDNITASYTTTEESKLAGIETSATADQTRDNINDLNVDAGSLDGASLSTATGLGVSNTLIPSQNATKVYDDGKVTTHNSSYHTSVVYFSGTKNATQTINHQTETRVTWPSITINSGNDLNVNGIFYCGLSGYYNFSVVVAFLSYTGWANGEHMDVYLRRYKQSTGTWGISFATRKHTFGTASNALQTAIGGQMWVPAGDYVDVTVYHRYGSAISISNSNTPSSFTGEVIGYN